MKKIKNLIFGISAILITSNISGCSLQKENNNTTTKYEFELENETNQIAKTISEIIIPETTVIVPTPTPSPTTTEIQLNEEDERKLVVLTFDDGPSRYTEDLLALLNEYDIKATFFVLGCNCDNYTSALLQMAEDGHEIAIHGETHTSFPDLGIEETTNEITNTINYIESLGIDASNLVRPPYGSLNSDLKENIEYPFILWNIDTEDWKTRDKDQIKQEIIDNIQEASIILMHDTNAVHKVDVEALKEILPELTKEYKFVTVSELCKNYNINLENGKVYRKIKSEN